MARQFAYVSFGILCLTAAYQLGVAARPLSRRLPLFGVRI